MSEPGSPEDLLSGMYKFMGIGKGQDVGKMLSTLVRNAQINMLKRLRRDIDNNIRELTQEGTTQAEYDPSLDPYKILGVDMNATREEIDKAFREKAMEVHPDRGGTNQDMIMVNAAYEAIKQFRGWK